MNPLKTLMLAGLAIAVGLLAGGLQDSASAARIIYSHSHVGNSHGRSVDNEVELANGYTGYTVAPRRESKGGALVVMLHEHAGRGDVFAPVGERLRIDDAWILSIQARHPAYDMESGDEIHGGSWWRWAPDDSVETQYESLQEEVGQLHGAIADFAQRKSIDPGRISLIGFAQGARMSQELAAYDPDGFNSVVLTGGYSEMLDEWRPSFQDADKVPDFFISIGDGEKQTPLPQARNLKSDLTSEGAEVVLAYVNKTHNILAREFKMINDWLAERLAAGSDDYEIS